MGIWPYGDSYLSEVCPLDYQAEIAAAKKAEMKLEQQSERLQTILSRPPAGGDSGDEATSDRDARQQHAKEMFSLLRRNASQESRSFTRKIENIVRQEFGIRKVGEAWISETILFQIVVRVCSGHDVLFHHRPEWLEGLELDIYIPDMKKAFEYQGIQHYRPIGAWGGQEAFEELRRRDARKALVCKRRGIRLIKVDYTDPLTEQHVRSLLEKTQ
jgi:hypothetical protein